MNDLQGKHIVLGLSGGIACYKAAELARALAKAGATVQVVMTAAAEQSEKSVGQRTRVKAGLAAVAVMMTQYASQLERTRTGKTIVEAVPTQLTD